MSGFVKLHTSILDSTVWLQSHATVRVWVTLLVLADARGYVAASIPGLARRANVSREECDEALAVFLAPDPDSRTKDAEGRRIMEVPGGWVVLNHAAYREARSDEARREQNRLAQQRFRERHGNKPKSKQGKPKQKAEAEAEAGQPLQLEAVPAPVKAAKLAPRDPRAGQVLDRIDLRRQELGKRPLPPSVRHERWIVARLEEGATLEDMLLAIDLRAAECRRDPANLRYLDAVSPFTAPGSRGNPGGWVCSMRMVEAHAEAQRRRGGVAPRSDAFAGELERVRLEELQQRDRDAAALRARGGAQ